MFKKIKWYINALNDIFKNDNYHFFNIKEQIKEFWLFNNKNKINLFRWRWMDNKNFWDILWPYIVEKITWKKIQYINNFAFIDRYMSIGSILSFSNKNTIIWWSWIITRDQIIKHPKKINSVRWPITRKRLIELWIKCPEKYWDPGLLISKFYKPKVVKKYKLWIIPHYIDYLNISNKIVDKDIKVINLLDPLEKVIDDIFSCELTISSSLHWLIVSHSYWLKSTLVSFSKKLAWDNTKFNDYFLSIWIEPYNGFDFSKQIPSKEKIINLINENHSEYKINYDEILESNPFNIK